MKIAVIGAGVTGSLLASLLDKENIEVSVFEKSRGCGGRVSTKQTDWGQCDLGASVVPAFKPQFVEFMEELCAQNIASKWPSQIFTSLTKPANYQELEHLVTDRTYYVFNQKMNAACRYWVANAQLNNNSLISQFRFIEGKGWQLKSNDNWLTQWFDKIVVTAPWPQTKALIEQSEQPFALPSLSQSWASCWSVGLKLDQVVSADIDLVYPKHQAIQTIIRDSGKPMRPQVTPSNPTEPNEIWVVQLANNISDELGKQAKEQAIEIATTEFCQLFDLPNTSVVDNYAHYWRYARPSAGTPPTGLISQPQSGFYAGGDWSYGASIESAYEAALSLSQSIMTGK